MLPSYIGLLAGRHPVNYLAFVNYLAIRAQTAAGQASVSNALKYGLTAVDSRINCIKTTASAIRGDACNKWWVWDSPFVLILNGTAIRGMNIDKGINILAWSTGPRNVKPQILENFSNMLINTAEAPLKPQQKLKLLTSYGLPRRIFELQITEVSAAKLLSQVDIMVWKRVCKWLHLPHNTCLPFFHAPVEYMVGLAYQSCDAETP